VPPDPVPGEKIHAAVVLSRPVPADELRRWVGSRLDAFKIPDVVHIVRELPTGATGKADRQTLRAMTLGAERQPQPG
jgi:acyl-coenzyme A synthetase/AMP-(fatty) acid ligase